MKIYNTQLPLPKSNNRSQQRIGAQSTKLLSQAASQKHRASSIEQSVAAATTQQSNFNLVFKMAPFEQNDNGSPPQSETVLTSEQATKAAMDE